MCIKEYSEYAKINKGIAPVFIYTGALFCWLKKGNKMDNFKRLSMQELYDVEGGIFGVDDAIFWTLVAAGFAGGIATGVSRKNRKEQCYE